MGTGHPVKYCVYNKQKFFVRAYQLRHNNFVKVEIVLHSGTLGKGKYYNLEKALRSAMSFFNRIEENLVGLSLNLHLDEYFFPEEFKKLVGVFNIELFDLKKSKYPSTRYFLIQRLRNDLLAFEESAKVKAKLFRSHKYFSILLVPTRIVQEDLTQLITLIRGALTFIIQSHSK